MRPLLGAAPVKLKPATEKAAAMSGSLKRMRSEEHTSELQSQSNLVCRLLLEKKNTITTHVKPSLCLHPPKRLSNSNSITKAPRARAVHSASAPYSHSNRPQSPTMLRSF